MEQAVNTFSKGLQFDTNPMVQGTDTLSNALNATFVTMNGNEIVLQNDMGNRRVDNAYLPSGYEPVGIKEYGGVIYIAAYNPITNRSQIGSFPSPERKINSKDDPNLKGTLDLDYFKNEKNRYQDLDLNLSCLKSDNRLIPLTKDTSLHAGDKFVVYGLNDSNNITNYNNINSEEDKVESPKNKLYTLALGILNSQNEFVDITKTLVRWDTNNKIIDFDNTKSDLYKFNSGYFIANTFENPELSEAKSDAELIQERQTIAANTYAYKLVGPLYLKATLNHIQDFSYNIYGTYDKETKEAELWIEGFVTYNCPDGITEVSTDENSTSNDSTSKVSTDDDNYYSYLEGTPSKDNFPVFDFYISSTESSKTPENVEYTQTKYDNATNTYTCKVTKHYKNINPTNGDILEYVIGVRAFNNEEIYLSGLSSKGSLDLSLLGSGKVELIGWRFINNFNNELGTLTYTFEAYPKYGTRFENLKFKFTNVIDSNDVHTYPAEGLPLNNGKTNLQINWKTIGLSPRKLYWVDIEYDKVPLEQNEINPKKVQGNNNTSPIWYLTTELFNKNYNSNSPDFYPHFREIKKALVNLNYDLNIIDNSKDLDSITEGSLLSKDNTKDIEYTITHKKLVNIITKPTVFFNENLYPDFISLPKRNVIEVKQENNLDDYSIDCVKEGSYNEENFIKGIKPQFNENILIYEDKFMAKGSQEEGIYIKDGFTSLKTFLNDLNNIYKSGDTNDFQYVVLYCEADEGSDKYWHIQFGKTKNKMSIHRNSHPDTVINIFTENGEERIKQVNDYKKTVFEEINNTIDKSIIFTFGFFKEDNYNRGLNYDRGGETQFFSDKFDNFGVEGRSRVNYSHYSRVWWRTTNGEWAIFYNMMTESEGIKNFLTNNINNNIKFAYYKEISLAEAELYIPDRKNYIYNQPYDTSIQIEFKIKNNQNINLNIDTNYQNNPLIFEVNSNNEEYTYNYSLPIKSDKTFQDRVTNVLFTTELSNIDIETGENTDSFGQPLSTNTIYKVSEDKKLVNWKNCPMSVSSEFGESGKRTLLYNANTKGSPRFRYDVYRNPEKQGEVCYNDYNNMIIVQNVN